MRTAVAGLILVATLACGEDSVKGPRSDVPAAPLAGVSPAALARLSQKRVYFGHQSVGFNLVDGMKAVLAEQPGLTLKLVASRSPGDLAPGTFAHGANGKNHEPFTKIEDFAATVERGGIGSSVDIAFFKFCYVDFQKDTDVEKVFDTYRTTLARLRAAHPGVRFVHVTSPLTVVRSGLRAWFAKVRGKRPWGADANVARERFNALLRREYAGKEPLYDLAAVESTRPDGTVQVFELDGRLHPGLVPEYSSDGNHLNATGSRWAAQHLLAVLARAAE